MVDDQPTSCVQCWVGFLVRDWVIGLALFCFCQQDATRDALTSTVMSTTSEPTSAPRPQTPPGQQTSGNPSTPDAPGKKNVISTYKPSIYFTAWMKDSNTVAKFPLAMYSKGGSEG
jgi:hypothetical protein